MADLEFSSFALLGSHLGGLEEAIPEAIEDTLNYAAIRVLQRIRKKFGNYQPPVGPFPGWDPLTPETIARRARRGIQAAENTPLLESEDLKESYQIEDASPGVVIGSDSPYAGVQETGNEHIPPRPVVGPSILEVELNSKDDLAEVFADVLLNGRRFRKLAKSKAAMDSEITPGYGRGLSVTEYGNEIVSK
jgi:hypothetical protein